MSYQVFVSYRRDGAEALAGNISEKLKKKGLKTFYDVESMRSGKFNEEIFSVIDSCSDVVVILPPKGLDRCVNEDDWVRKEIAYAIKKKKNIVPVMMRNFEFPEELPEDIKEIRNYHGINATMEYFDASFKKLLSLLDAYLKKQRIKKVLLAITIAVVSICLALGVYFFVDKSNNIPSGTEQDSNIYQIDTTAPQITISEPSFNTGTVEFTVYVEEDSEFLSINLNNDTVETIGFTAAMEIIDQGRKQILKFSNLQVNSGNCQIILLSGAAKDAENNMSAECSSEIFSLDTDPPRIASIKLKNTDKIIKEGDTAVYMVTVDDNTGVAAVAINRENIVTYGFVADISIKKINGNVREITFSNIKFNDSDEKYFVITEGVVADTYGNLNEPSKKIYLKTK